MVTSFQRNRHIDAHAQASTTGAEGLLRSVAEAAQCLVATENLAAAIPAALRILGLGTRQDRVYVFENVFPNGPDELFLDLLCEWNSSHGMPIADIAEQFPFPANAFPNDSISLPLKRGEAVQSLTRDLEGLAAEMNRDILTKSMIVVPISVGGLYWGSIGFDDCTTERVWSAAEVAVLETAAACIGSAIERDRTAKARMAEMEAHNQALAERDRILEATAAAANVMLVNDDFESAVTEALRIVGEGLAVDRVGIGSYFAQTSEEDGYHEFLYEWDSEGTNVQIEHPELSKISDRGIGDFINALKTGHVFGGVVEEMGEPFRSSQIEMGVKSAYAIAIIVAGKYWGAIALDDCHKQTRRSESELEALKTLANCIGSAIERDQIRAAREAAERTAIIERERAARADELEAANKVLLVRDRWLQTTAAAANELLSTTDVPASVNAALATIGENLECDRISVLRYIADHKSHPLGAMKGLYEWDAEGIKPQIEDSALSVITAEGFEDWFKTLLAGNWVGSNVSDLPEPARSGQESLGVLSTYAVPIFIDNALWGIVAMDYCHEEKRLEASEIAVFQTAATCVGSAIHQAQVRRDKAARERSRLLGSVAQAANLLLESSDYQSVLSEVVRLLGEATGSDRCSILQEAVTSSSQELGVTVVTEWCNVGTQHSYVHTPELSDALSWRVIPELHESFLSGGISNVLVSDMQEPARTILSEQGNTAMMCVTIVVNGKPWGVISFDNCGEPRLYDEAEISILQIAAESIASAISRQAQDKALRDAEKFILQEQEKAARDRVTELAKTNEAISTTLTTLATSPELDQFLGTILSEMVRPLGACKAHLFLYDEPTHTLSQRVVIQDDQLYMGAGPNDPDMFKHPISADLTAGWDAIINSNRPITYDETLPYDENIWWPESLTWHKAQGHKAVTCIPLKAGEQPIGYIGFCFYNHTFLTDEQLEFMQALANQAIIAIQLTRLADDSKTAALSVALTEERNRLAREIHDTLAQAFTGISLQLEAAKGSFDESTEDTLYHMNRAGNLARRGLSEARRSVRALRSAALTTNTLPEALTIALTEMTQDSPTTPHLHIVGTPYTLPEDIQTNLLRIGQEATTNTLRHAQADTLNITLTYKPTQIRMTISDDGKGCDISLDNVEGFGLLGMRERVLRFDGQFALFGTPGRGTVIEIAIPLDL